MFSHAVVTSVPNSLQFANKKSTLDIESLRKQSEGLVETLREANVIVNEYRVPDDSPMSSLFMGDAAVAINGTAVLCRPRQPGVSHDELRRILPSCCYSIQECPESSNGEAVVLDGGDVFFTGDEIFVGVRKHGTNFEGAKAVARVFCDHTVIPVFMSDKAECLRYYVAVAAPGVLAIGTSKEAENVLHVLETEASFRYKVIPVEDDEGVNCIFVNNRLIFQRNKSATSFTPLQSDGLELWTVDAADLLKAGSPLMRHCLLVWNRHTSKKHR